jgi:glycerol kinase
MQLQADILGIPVSRPMVLETTALGAAYAAGLAVGFWTGRDELAGQWHEGGRWEPSWDDVRRTEGHRQWRKAVDRTLDWHDGPDEGGQP